MTVEAPAAKGDHRINQSRKGLALHRRPHPAGSPGYEEEQQMQQYSSEYWAEHFRNQIADRPDIQKYLREEEAREAARNRELRTSNRELLTGD